MVAVSHMSNVLGTINPVAEIIAEAHAAGALTLIDGCQAIVHRDVDVQALDADFYVFSGHKLYGPTGIGVALRQGRAPGGPAALPGRRRDDRHGHPGDRSPTPIRRTASRPARRRSWRPSASARRSTGWRASTATAVAAHEHALYDRVKERLNGANWLTEIGTAPGKGAIFSFNVEGAHAHDVAQILDRYGVAVRAGTHCAEPLMRRFGVTSSARASFALYNTLEEADAFVDALTKTRTFFALMDDASHTPDRNRLRHSARRSSTP